MTSRLSAERANQAVPLAYKKQIKTESYDSVNTNTLFLIKYK